MLKGLEQLQTRSWPLGSGSSVNQTFRTTALTVARLLDVFPLAATPFKSSMGRRSFVFDPKSEKSSQSPRQPLHPRKDAVANSPGTQPWSCSAGSDGEGSFGTWRARAKQCRASVISGVSLFPFVEQLLQVVPKTARS